MKIQVGQPYTLQICLHQSVGEIQSMHFHWKQKSFCAIIEALDHYPAFWWTINICPWLVRIRGLVGSKPIQKTLSFLDIPKVHKRELVENRVTASLWAFALEI
jgi:hypothetical protein